MTQSAAQTVSFPCYVRDNDTPISELSEVETVWVAKKEAAQLINLVAMSQIAEISESFRQCIQRINTFCLKHAYPSIDADL